MPNFFGGSQYHPAYGYPVHGNAQEILVGEINYMIKKRGRKLLITAEHLDGRMWTVSRLETIPASVRRYIKTLRRKWRKLAEKRRRLKNPT